MYDDIAVEKLQQIALYYQLGLKRDEIKEIMLTPNYDSNMILQTLLAMEQEKKVHIERHIAALEYLILVGTKNGVSGSLRGISLDELGRTLLAVREASAEDGSSHAVTDEHAAIFAREFSSLIAEYDFQPRPQLAELDRMEFAYSSVRTTIQHRLCQKLSKLGWYKKRELFPALGGLFS